MSVRRRLIVNEKGELEDRDGTVVGRLISMVVELGERGTTGGERTTSGDFQSPDLENSPRDGGVGEGQASMLPDPVDEVWALYETLLRRRKRKISSKERGWVSKAIKACGVEQVKLAVRGLAASEHHRSGGWTGIEYAVRPKANETVESRITMMAAKVPVHDSQATDGRLTIQELLHGYTGYNRQRVLDWMKDVRRALIEPSEQNTKMAALAEQELSDRAGIIVIERGERNLIWGKKA